jgi:hypothetical protein
MRNPHARVRWGKKKKKGNFCETAKNCTQLSPKWQSQGEINNVQKNGRVSDQAITPPGVDYGTSVERSPGVTNLLRNILVLWATEESKKLLFFSFIFFFLTCLNQLPEVPSILTTSSLIFNQLHLFIFSLSTTTTALEKNGKWLHY